MNWQVVQFLLPAFCICLILTGIHVYLGIHVLSRGVIFVDLALAQIAALGATVAFLIGLPHEGGVTYFVSLAFTLIGAALFAATRNVEKRRIPQEAIIGVTYAISSAAIIILTDKSSHGAEHIKDMLVGNILWVSWQDVLTTLCLYSVISVFHYKYRKQFFLLSLEPEKAKTQKLSLKFWDLLFYSSFGFVITSSVKVAGVLLVFSYLVVPSIIGMLFSTTIKGRLGIGWSVGFLASVFGLTASYIFDLPTGACLVVLFGILLLIAGAIRWFTS